MRSLFSNSGSPALPLAAPLAFPALGHARVSTSREAGSVVKKQPDFDPSVGLCSTCIHARQVANTRGSIFSLCDRALADPRFRKYPPLPVVSCFGFEPVEGCKDCFDVN